jgi:hypothetical protein
MSGSSITESISLSMNFEYQFTEGVVSVSDLEGFFIPYPAIEITGSLQLDYNASHDLIGVEDVNVTISGGGLPTEILTSGTVDPSYVNGNLTIDELDLSGGYAQDGNPHDAVYSNLYLDFEAPGGTGGFEDSFNYGEPFTHLATSFASYYDSSQDPDGRTSCFTAGTEIMTPSGPVAIETLKIGDLVTLSDGRVAQMTWLGVKAIATRFADPVRVLPVRVKAGALGQGLPTRDLLISPDHAILIDGILVNAGALVNGVSIVRETNMPEKFSYYHVEVADHALVLAEGVAVETFVDNVDRMSFDNWVEHEALYGHLPGIIEMDTPRARSARQVPSATQKRLLARAKFLFGAKLAA